MRGRGLRGQDVAGIPPTQGEAIDHPRFQANDPPGKEADFEAFLHDTAVPLLSRQKGLVDQHVGKPRDPTSTECVYVTVWEDVDSIGSFAGEDWQAAVITPDEEHLLSDTWIGHYEVVANH